MFVIVYWLGDKKGNERVEAMLVRFEGGRAARQTLSIYN